MLEGEGEMKQLRNWRLGFLSKREKARNSRDQTRTKKIEFWSPKIENERFQNVATCQAIIRTVNFQELCEPQWK